MEATRAQVDESPKSDWQAEGETAMGEVAAPAGFWEREASHSPLPHSPMNRSLFFESRNSALRKTFRKYGVFAEGLEMREIGGWEYSRLVPLGGKEPPALPGWLARILVRLHPEMRRRARTARDVAEGKVAFPSIAAWNAGQRGEFDATIRTLREVNPAELSDADLMQHWQTVRAFLDRGIDLHFDLHGALCIIQAELAFTARDLLGWDDARTLQLLTGLSATSTEPGRQLEELVRQASLLPVVRRLIEHGADYEEIKAADPEFARVLDEYQRNYGTRALRYEVAEAALVERPDILVSTMRDLLARGQSSKADPANQVGQRDAGRAEARKALAVRSEAERNRFEEALARAEASYGVREENEFYTISVPFALARFTLLELGSRLAARGQLDDPSDVFRLEIEEALAAFSDGKPAQQLVEQRKAEAAWVAAHPGPASYGSLPPPPSLDVLPEPSRRVMESVIWYQERIMEAALSSRQQAAEDEGLRGVAASPGSFRGTVRVVMGEHEFDKIQAGDILVCPVTSPVWSVLFSRLGALVTDKGGILSHPAIIAREYGIPAVVGTGNATEILRDGQVVEVDGSSGRVRVI